MIWIWSGSTDWEVYFWRGKTSQNCDLGFLKGGLGRRVGLGCSWWKPAVGSLCPLTVAVHGFFPWHNLKCLNIGTTPLGSQNFPTPLHFVLNESKFLHPVEMVRSEISTIWLLIFDVLALGSRLLNLSPQIETEKYPYIDWSHCMLTRLLAIGHSPLHHLK